MADKKGNEVSAQAEDKALTKALDGMKKGLEEVQDSVGELTDEGEEEQSPEQQAISSLQATGRKVTDYSVKAGKKLLKDASPSAKQGNKSPEKVEESPEHTEIRTVEENSSPTIHQESEVTERADHLQEHSDGVRLEDSSDKVNVKSAELPQVPTYAYDDSSGVRAAMSDAGISVKFDDEVIVREETFELGTNQDDLELNVTGDEVRDVNVLSYHDPYEYPDSSSAAEPYSESPVAKRRKKKHGEKRSLSSDRISVDKETVNMEGEDNNPLSLRTRIVDEKSIQAKRNSPVITGESISAEGGIKEASSGLAQLGENGQEAVRTLGAEGGKAVGEGVAEAGAGAASAGTTVAVKVGEKIIEKVKETLQNAVKETRESPRTISTIAVFFFAPILALFMLISAVTKTPIALNAGLSDAVLALMPQIREACEKYNIPEYVPLVAAVVMQESGGDADLVHGDVMQCAEGMGYPVGTPVPVDQSIDYGTYLIAGLLQRTGVTAIDDLPNIKIALQAYNYGGGFIPWLNTHYHGEWSQEAANEFSDYMAGVTGWSGYGDKRYVEHVLRYYTIGYCDDHIVTVALSQIGNVGGAPYWSWYGFGDHVDWCACFVSWCANQCGYIDAGAIPKYASCRMGVQWFKNHGQFIDGSAEPSPGMIIFFDWNRPGGSSGPQDGDPDHTGIVVKVENGYVYTVEGNSGDCVRACQYPIGHYEIYGYGIPAY